MINDAVTEEIPLVLAELDHHGWGQPLRLVANTENVVSNGKTYTAAGFEIAMADQVEGHNGEMRFSLVDADTSTLALLRTTSDVIEVTVSWVLASDPDTVYAGPIDAEIRAAEGQFGMISGALTTYPVLSENAVAGDRFRFNHKHWPGVL
jgi:hypothetical protein